MAGCSQHWLLLICIYSKSPHYKPAQNSTKILQWKFYKKCLKIHENVYNCNIKQPNNLGDLLQWESKPSTLWHCKSFRSPNPPTPAPQDGIYTTLTKHYSCHSASSSQSHEGDNLFNIPFLLLHLLLFLSHLTFLIFLSKHPDLFLDSFYMNGKQRHLPHLHTTC